MVYPEIDPVLFSLGPFPVRWYGLMYLGGFVAAYFLALSRSKKPGSHIKTEQVEDLILYCAFGVVLGGRMGYVLFYKFPLFLENPLWLFKVWEGGMSFHGGLIGVLISIGLYGRKIGKGFWITADYIAPMIPVGLGLGRLGNFINQELWGRATDVSWGMVFPNDPLGVTRHPSQLYEFALEGVVLFTFLYWYSSKPRPVRAVSGFFLLLYGVFRFFVEFYRVPDNHLGYDFFDWMTRGQTLCVPMIIAGLIILWTAFNNKAVK